MLERFEVDNRLVSIQLIIESRHLLHNDLIQYWTISGQLEEIGRVFCALLDWAVQLESVPIVKLMVFALRRFIKADKNRKYRNEMLNRYRTALKIFNVDNGTSPHVRLEPEIQQPRRRASSITECYYNGDTVGAMQCLVQHAGG